MFDQAIWPTAHPRWKQKGEIILVVNGAVECQNLVDARAPLRIHGIVSTGNDCALFPRHGCSRWHRAGNYLDMICTTSLDATSLSQLILPP